MRESCPCAPCNKTPKLDIDQKQIGGWEVLNHEMMLVTRSSDLSRCCAPDIGTSRIDTEYRIFVLRPELRSALLQALAVAWVRSSV